MLHQEQTIQLTLWDKKGAQIGDYVFDKKEYLTTVNNALETFLKYLLSHKEEILEQEVRLIPFDVCESYTFIGKRMQRKEYTEECDIMQEVYKTYANYLSSISSFPFIAEVPSAIVELMLKIKSTKKVKGIVKNKSAVTNDDFDPFAAATYGISKSNSPFL